MSLRCHYQLGSVAAVDILTTCRTCLSVCLSVRLCVCVCVRARLWLYGGGVHDYVYSIIMSRLAGRRRRR